MNTDGSFTCTCNMGFSGDGTIGDCTGRCFPWLCNYDSVVWKKMYPVSSTICQITNFAQKGQKEVCDSLAVCLSTYLNQLITSVIFPGFFPFQQQQHNCKTKNHGIWLISKLHGLNCHIVYDDMKHTSMF